MGYAHQHHNLGPSIQEYFKNQFVMAFNLCGDGCVGGHDHVSEYGSFVRTFCAQNKFFIRRHFACCFVLSASCATSTATDTTH